MKTLLTQSLLLLASLFTFEAVSFAATSEELLSNHFYGTAVEIVKASSTADLALAQYKEEGPTVTVAVAERGGETLYYAELSDEGAILVSVDVAAQEVTTVLQAHTISCHDVKATFSAGDVAWSVCK